MCYTYIFTPFSSETIPILLAIGIEVSQVRSEHDLYVNTYDCSHHTHHDNEHYIHKYNEDCLITHFTSSSSSSSLERHSFRNSIIVLITRLDYNSVNLSHYYWCSAVIKIPLLQYAPPHQPSIHPSTSHSFHKLRRRRRLRCETEMVINIF